MRHAEDVLDRRPSWEAADDLALEEEDSPGDPLVRPAPDDEDEDDDDG